MILRTRFLSMSKSRFAPQRVWTLKDVVVTPVACGIVGEYLSCELDLGVQPPSHILESLVQKRVVQSRLFVTFLISLRARDGSLSGLRCVRPTWPISTGKPLIAVA